MVANILYTKDSPMERDIAYFIRRLKQLQVDSKMIEADSPEGVAMAENYDLLGRPAVILAGLDGTPIQHWEGELPQPEDVSYLAHQ